MTVRGTTHARHHQVIVIREGAAEGERITCAWDDCDNDALALFVLRVWDQYKRGFGPPSQYAFCSMRHKGYWLASPRHYGRLPPGMRDTIL